MKDDKLQINCKSVNAILKYAQDKGKDIAYLIHGLGYDEAYLTDTNNWLPLEVANEISRRLRVMFDDDQIMYKVGLSCERLHSLGFIDFILRLMASPQFIIRHAPKLNKYFSSIDAIEILQCNAHFAKIKYFPLPGYTMNLDDCYFTKGIFAVLPKIWGNSPAKIEEETCAIPIHKKGRINGKYYSVDEQGYVFEHDVLRERAGIDTPKKIGKLNNDGSFKLGNTIYGAKACVYSLSWAPRRLFLAKLFYDFFQKPRVLQAAIEEMEQENDIILKKNKELQLKNLQLQHHYIDTINALIRVIDAKDHYTEDHSLNVCRIAEEICRGMALPSAKVETIQQACKLHDLGKVGIKDSILLKPGKLTEEEWQEIKKHPILGSEIIRPLAFLSEVAVLIRQDHERWDGQGYPDGLKGNEIDIGSRIIMLADAYDAMTSGRPYKKAMTKEEAIEEIKKNSGSQFDPLVVEGFLKIVDRI